MPLPAILVPRFHLLPNDSEIKQRNNPPPPCVQYISWFWFTRYQNNTTSPIYLSRCPPPHTPQQCSYGARPMVLCTRSLGKECHPLSGYTGARHCKYECRTKHPGTKHPMPFFATPDKTSRINLPPRTKHPMQFLSPRTKHPMPFLPPRTKHPMLLLPPRTKHPTLCLKPMKVHKTFHLVNCHYYY